MSSKEPVAMTSHSSVAVEETEVKGESEADGEIHDSRESPVDKKGGSDSKPLSSTPDTCEYK